MLYIKIWWWHIYEQKISSALHPLKVDIMLYHSESLSLVFISLSSLLQQQVFWYFKFGTETLFLSKIHLLLAFVISCYSSMWKTVSSQSGETDQDRIDFLPCYSLTSLLLHAPILYASKRPLKMQSCLFVPETVNNNANKTWGNLPNTKTQFSTFAHKWAHSKRWLNWKCGQSTLLLKNCSCTADRGKNWHVWHMRVESLCTSLLTPKSCVCVCVWGHLNEILSWDA